MKNIKLVLLFLFLIPFFAFSQITVSGKVVDKETKEVLSGVDVAVKGTTKGTVSDFDGNYTIQNVNLADVLVFTYIGYKPVEVVVKDSKIDVEMEESAETLDEVVVIGYGSTRKQDATGSVQKISTEDFNQGSIVSPEQLLTGKSAGVRITSGGGAPGEGSEIRIRGGASLTANNSPLIVIDGLPLDQRGVQGVRNQLNAINPNDIRDFVVLKDASATAIYGSRASNGVILITTKKGHTNSSFKIDYDVKTSIQNISKYVDVLDVDDFRTVVQTDSDYNPALLGSSETDWQKEIYTNGSGVIHDLTFSQGFDSFNYRISLNHTYQNGILRTDTYQRDALNLALTQRLLDNNLKLTITSKGIVDKNRFANRGAIGAAIAMDPTQPIYDPTSPFDGFFEFRTGDQIGDQIVLAPRNPLALLMQNDNRAKNKRNISNFNVDYKLWFLKGLRFNMNAGVDYSELNGKQYIPVTAASNSQTVPFKNYYSGLNRNLLLDFYFNYKADLENYNTKVDFTVGHSYQEFFIKSRQTVTDNNNLVTKPVSVNRNSLESYFARASFDIADKYLFSLSYRRDGSSRFSENNRWGNFPAASFGWKMTNEDFLKDSKWVSNLKLRLSWGITGQQEIGENYGYLGIYTPGSDDASVQFGTDFVNTIRPEEFDENLKWEETTQYNLGLDFGLFNNKVNGTFDVYYRKTKDLLATVPTPAGANLSDLLTTNVGSTVSKGVEFGLNSDVVKSENFNWNLAFNMTFQDVEITNLSLGDDPNFFILQGGISGGVGNKIQVWREGLDPSTYFVFRQVYDTNGNPIEGAFVDVNGDNQITEADRVPFKKATPDVYAGFTSSISYKNFDFNVTFRGSYGNYIYNNVASDRGAFEIVVDAPGDYYPNGHASLLESNFYNQQLFSDYYIQRADFVKLDNLSLGYSFKGKKVNFRTSLTASNILTITNYDGIDPEISNGIDNNFYPRPQTFVLGLGITF
jgi:iron complex outermembrane receptor protein